MHVGMYDGAKTTETVRSLVHLMKIRDGYDMLESFLSYEQ
jgi:hypothetical protein